MPPVIGTDELTISGMSFPPYSTRSAQQSLTPIDAATQLARTVNGVLADVGDPDLFRKYRSQIVCTDQQVPQFVWPGTLVTVHCIHELSYPTSGGTPDRTSVEYSERVDGDYTFYRPVLIMRVVSFTSNHDDWGRNIGWTIDLEEV